MDDLAGYHIDTSRCEFINNGKTPTSYITLNQHNGSRTIVHYRDLPELTAASIYNAPLEDAHWIHFEGRNVERTKEMLAYVKQQRPQLPVSLEIEKPRDQLELLFPGADVYFFSRAFAEKQNFQSAAALLQHYRQTVPEALLVCSWGDNGAYALAQDKLLFAPAPHIDPVVDTIGAGDTFNAGFINARLNGSNVSTALEKACTLAAKKCSKEGFAGLANDQ